MAGMALSGLKSALRPNGTNGPVGQAPPPLTGAGTTGGMVYDPTTNSYVQQSSTPTMGSLDPNVQNDYQYNRSRRDARVDEDRFNANQDMARQQAQSTLNGLMASTGGMGAQSMGGGSGGGPASIAAPKTPDHVADIRPVDTSRADSAAFAKAKDQVGQTASGALSGLRSALAGRGMLGSGMEARGAAAIANRGQGELGDVSRQQAVTDVNLQQQADKANQESQIAQRGQDLGAGNAAFSGLLTQRGQDIQQQESQAQIQQQQAEMQMQQRQQILAGLLKNLY